MGYLLYIKHSTVYQNDEFVFWVSAKVYIQETSQPFRWIQWPSSTLDLPHAFPCVWSLHYKNYSSRNPTRKTVESVTLNYCDYVKRMNIYIIYHILRVSFSFSFFFLSIMVL